MAFGDLVQDLFIGQEKAINPSVFKRWIEKIDQKYVGDDHHDCQELLGLLLTTMHEDLNEITEKPYIE